MADSRRGHPGRQGGLREGVRNPEVRVLRPGR